jgi:hypothetical protein
MSGLWLNFDVTGVASGLFDQALRERRLERSARLEEAAIAFGQPDPDTVFASPHLRWIHLSSAGYTRYDVESRNMCSR